MQFRVLGLAGSLVLLSLALVSCRPPETNTALTCETYVWQRAHTGAVADSVREHAPAFSRLVALAAEVSWQHDQASVVRVPLSVPALQAASSLGLAIRINAFRGSFAADADASRTLRTLATSLLADAQKSGLHITELQLDFDASEKRLADYRLWLAALRPEIPADIRLTFTALPSWLKHKAEFAALAAAADSYVLQVHSLSRPQSPDDLVSLCDPPEARRALTAAARFGRPFRLALPTYGYRLAFDSQGRFFALSAEGPRPAWPAGTTVRELEADPVSLATLVADLRIRHPQSLTGIIWYRLPVAGDRLNWSWPTLAAVMIGETPVARPALETSTDGAGLVECFAVNTGNAPFNGPLSGTLTWTGASRLAADFLPPFTSAQETATSLRLTTTALRLPPASRQSVGWLRLDHPPHSLDVSPSP